mmetsp:Transcript_8503/g.21224  ORF Transcript_8503/g.21224 Transcript_8503/m.21224 type:complete len:205 (+) Transcript_8503:958-1572(+)
MVAYSKNIFRTALGSIPASFGRGMTIDMSFPYFRTSSSTSSFRPLYSSSVARSASVTMFDKTRTRDCGAGGVATICCCGRPPLKAFRAALAMSRGDGPPGAPGTAKGWMGAIGCWIPGTRNCGIAGTGRVGVTGLTILVNGIPYWSRYVGIVGIGLVPIAASTSSSTLKPLTMLTSGGRFAAPGAATAAATTGAVAVVAVDAPR